jgi:hypothetical protein
MVPPPSFWKMDASEMGEVSAVLFSRCCNLAVGRDTRIAVNCDTFWRQSRTQPLSASVAAKGWAIGIDCDATDLCNTQALDREGARNVIFWKIGQNRRRGTGSTGRTCSMTSN